MLQSNSGKASATWGFMEITRTQQPSSYWQEPSLALLHFSCRLSNVERVLLQVAYTFVCGESKLDTLVWSRKSEVNYERAIG